MKKTRLMEKLFSDSTDAEFKQKVMDGFDEAKETGEAIIEDDEEKLVLKSTEDGEVEITDADGEVTIAKENPEDPEDIKLEPKEVDESDNELSFDVIDADGNGVITKDEWIAAGMPAEKFEEIDADGNGVITKDEFEVFTQKAESDTAPDVEVERVPGVDGEHIEKSAPSVEVTVTTGITDKDKAGLKSYSIKFYGTQSYSQIYKTSKAVQKAFSDCPACVTAKSLENAAEENLDNAEPSEEEKHYSEVSEDIAHNANQLAQAADDLEDTQDPELAKEVKELCDKVMAEVEKIEAEAGDQVDYEDIKEQCKKYAEAADAVISKSEEKPADEDKEDKTEEKSNEDKEDKPEEKSDEDKEDKPEEKSEKEVKAEEIAKKAEELEKAAEELKDDDEKGAEELKAECDKLMADIEEADSDEEIIIDDEVKDKVESFSKKAQDIIKKNTRSFSSSLYMKPQITVNGEQKLFSKPSKKTSLNPYLFK